MIISLEAYTTVNIVPLLVTNGLISAPGERIQMQSLSSAPLHFYAGDNVPVDEMDYFLLKPYLWIPVEASNIRLWSELYGAKVVAHKDEGRIFPVGVATGGGL